MKIKQKKPKVNQVFSTCCWCGLKIKKDEPVYSIGCKKRPEADLSKYEDKVMPVKIVTAGKTVWSFVPPPGSEARKDGHDFLFALCSEECGKHLKAALEKEKEIGEKIFSIGPVYG